MKWYLKALKQYANFNGRARRKEFWFFCLFNFFFFWITTIILAASSDTLVGVVSVVNVAYMFFIFIPILAVIVRRLHDTGKSGWWFFVTLIPIVGIAFLCMDSVSGTNQYGADPKAAERIILNTDKINGKVPDICPVCKNPNTKKTPVCEWCGSKVC